ncbi:MAG: hypothetical protein HC881_19650 [Leptolyngbyaceae cyanobacterium SL_7_1]|nr:hypothetical protein [Leptolyngbyaceae cyanobacterium SL_7_1]
MLRFLEASHQWVPLPTGLDALNVTALLAIAAPGAGRVAGDRGSRQLTGSQTRFTQELQPGDTLFALGQALLVLQINSDTDLWLGAPLSIDLPPDTPFAIDTLLAGTADGKLWRSRPTLKPGRGSLSGMGAETDGSFQVIGCGTSFTDALVGGRLTIANQSYPIASVTSESQLTLSRAIDQDVFNQTYVMAAADSSTPIADDSTISSSRDRTLLIGCQTRFRQAVAVGDEVLLLDASGAVVETRTVTAIESDTVLRIDRAMERDRIHQSFVLRRSSWSAIPIDRTGATAILNTRINVLIQVEQAGERFVLAATAGNGVFRSNDHGVHWEAMNQGLTQLNVQAIAYDTTTLWAGTDGSGVFRSQDGGLTWTGGDPIDPEIRQTGLTAPTITSFAINPLNHDLFVGTLGGGVFRSSDGGDRWTAMNRGLAHSTITALLSFTQAGTGTISSCHRRVTGQATQFQAELQEGDSLTVNGQTRVITAIDNAPDNALDNALDNATQQLSLNDAFDPRSATRDGFPARHPAGGYGGWHDLPFH